MPAGDDVSPLFAIHEERLAGVTVLAVRGELDIASAPRLSEQVIGAALGGARDLVVDLARTSFIDSIGTSALIRLTRMLRDRGGELVVIAPEALERTFGLIQAELMLTMVADQDEALDELSARRARRRRSEPGVP